MKSGGNYDVNEAVEMVVIVGAHTQIVLYTQNTAGTAQQRQSQKSTSTTSSNSPPPTLSGGDDLLFYCRTNARLL